MLQRSLPRMQNRDSGIFYVNIAMVGGIGIYPFVLTEEGGVRVEFTKVKGPKCKSSAAVVLQTLDRDPTAGTTTDFQQIISRPTASAVPRKNTPCPVSHSCFSLR